MHPSSLDSSGDYQQKNGEERRGEEREMSDLDLVSD